MNKFYLLGSGISAFTAGLIVGIISVGEYNPIVADIVSFIVNQMSLTIFVLALLSTVFLYYNREEDVNYENI